MSENKIIRTITEEIQKSMFQSDVIIIVGPRQVGKTTLLKTLLERVSTEKIIQFNGDFFQDRQDLQFRSEKEMHLVFSRYEYIVIDEAQKVENIGNILKSLRDAYGQTKQILVTGSSTLGLLDQTTEPLTGRKKIFHLYPIAFSELNDTLGLRDARARLEETLLYGMYPQVLSYSDIDAKKEKLQDIVSGQLYRDILEFQDIKNPDILHRLLELLAIRIGSEVSYHAMAQLLGVSQQTIERYIDLLEKSFVIFRLRPYMTNKTKEVTKMKKIYFYDLGIRNSLLRSFQSLGLRCVFLFLSCMFRKILSFFLILGLLIQNLFFGILDVSAAPDADGSANIDLVLTPTIPGSSILGQDFTMNLQVENKNTSDGDGYRPGFILSLPAGVNLVSAGALGSPTRTVNHASGSTLLFFSSANDVIIKGQSTNYPITLTSTNAAGVFVLKNIGILAYIDDNIYGRGYFQVSRAFRPYRFRFFLFSIVFLSAQIGFSFRDIPAFADIIGISSSISESPVHTDKIANTTSIVTTKNSTALVSYKNSEKISDGSWILPYRTNPISDTSWIGTFPQNQKQKYSLRSYVPPTFSSAPSQINTVSGVSLGSYSAYPTLPLASLAMNLAPMYPSGGGGSSVSAGQILETLLSGMGILSGDILPTDSILQAFSKIQGNTKRLEQDMVTLSGSWNGVQSTLHDAVTLGSANGLFLSGQQLSLGLASSGSNGALSNTDWNTFNAKISSLNGLTGANQLFAVSTAGNSFSVSSSGNTHTFILPDASLLARGLVSTGAQSFLGTKTFSSAPIFSGFTAGSIPFIGSGGVLAQNNSRLFYDATNIRLGIGTNTPSNTLTASGVNPLALIGVQNGTIADRFLTITATGLVRQVSSGSLATTLCTGSVTLFCNGGNPSIANMSLGTTTNFGLDFRTNNLTRMSLSGGPVGSGTILNFLNSTSNTLLWNTAGVGFPTLTSRSAGTKMVLYPNIGTGTVDYALGIGTNTLWQSVPTTTGIFAWYGGTGAMMTLSNNQLSLTQSGANFSLSAPNAYGSIGRTSNNSYVLDVYRNIANNGYVSRYGVNTTLNRTESSDLTAGGTIYTMGQNTNVSYIQSAPHTLGTIDVRGANIGVTSNVTKSGATVNVYGMVSNTTNMGIGHANSLYAISASASSTSSALTDQNALGAGSYTAYNNGTGVVTALYGQNIAAYNNNNTGTIGNLYGVNISTNVGIGKGSVGGNYGINVSTSNGSTTQRALNYSSYISDPIRKPSVIDGIYGTTYYNATGSTPFVRGLYSAAYVATGSATAVRAGEFDARDGSGGTIGVYGYARANLMQTGAYLRGGSFSIDAYGTTNFKTITDAYGIYSSTTNAAGTAWAKYTNQYGGYFSASASANSNTAYGLHSQVTGPAKNNYGIYANVSSATATGTEGLTNNWGIYINGATKNYLTGRVGIGTTTPTKALDVAGDITASVSVSSALINASGSLNIAGKKVLSMPSNSPERGPWNPFWNALGSSKGLFQDEDFAQGMNGIVVYNNSGGTGVTITRQTGQVGVPNSSGVRLKITYDGIAAVSPGYGGFLTPFTPGYNKTYVQRFRALLPVGYSLVLAENAQGTNNTSYWLTDVQGTGKWEDYIRISHAGNTGALSAGGHVYITGGTGAVTWYLASLNVYEMNTSQYMANNTWQGGQTFASGTILSGTGIWNASGSVGIGTYTPATKLQVLGDIRVGTSGTNGCIQGFGGATIAGTCSSDERLKSNIFDIGNVLEKFQDLRIVNYNWNHLAADLYKNDSSQKQTGFLAQNIETLFPELISTNTEGYKQVNYSAMNLYGLEAIKELNTKMNQSLSGVNLSIADLSARNTALETNQSMLFSEMSSLSGKVFSIGNMTGTIVNNYYSTTNQTIVQNTGSTDVSGSGIILPANITILDQMEQTIDALFFRIAVIFRESVQFLKEVTFASRVTFEDRDMAGTAVMPVGSNHTHVSFIHPYEGIPKITLSSDSFIAHRVVNKTRYGFDIEMERSSNQEISFDWMALYIPGNDTVTVVDSNPSVSSTNTASGESISLIASDSGTLIQSGGLVSTGASESSGSIMQTGSGGIENLSGSIVSSGENSLVNNSGGVNITNPTPESLESSGTIVP